MRELLKTTDRRRLEVIEVLIDLDGWISLEELAEKANTTTRNLKGDLTYFRERYPEIGIESSYQGVRLIMNASTGMQEFYRMMIRDNLYFQLLEEIFFNEKYTVEDLAERLHTSPSTVYRAIETLNNYFAQYHCTIESNPCRIVGDETYIRNLYKTYFKEAYSIFEWPFRLYNEADVDNNIHRVSSMLFKSNPSEANIIDFAFYRAIKLMVLVHVTRFHHQHRINTDLVESRIVKILLKVARNFAFPKYIKSITGEPFSVDYIYQVFYPYLTKDMAFNTKSLDKIRNKNSRVDTAIRHLENSLHMLSEELDIPIQTEHLMVALYGTSVLEEHDANSMHIFYDRNLLFNKRIHRHFPHTHQRLYDIVKQFRSDLGLSDHEEKVQYMVYTLFTNWENLLSDLYTHYQRTKVLVLSDANFAHASLIKNLLSIELANNVVIDNYSGKTISIEALDSMDYDLIVSNFKLPELNNKESVVLGHYLTSQDIQRINNILQSIIQCKTVAL